MSQLQDIEDRADLKNHLSTYLRSVPTCDRLDTTVTLNNSTGAQAVHDLKMMWALCEIAKEEKSWRPQFDSFEDFKATLPFSQRGQTLEPQL